MPRGMTARLRKTLVEKPWGRVNLPSPFAQADGRRIGEIWFDSDQSGLLVKFIFTDEKLSVQLHPTDDQTLARGLGRQGKDECWLILDARPGATIAIGFEERHERAAIESAAKDGSIEDRLRWFPVTAGDFFYIPANTVHAIGAGVTLLEIQQDSNLTYRLFDYGRGRELHLHEALPIADLGPYDQSLHRRLAPQGSRTLVEGPRFRLDRLDDAPSSNTADRYRGQPLLLIPLTEHCYIGHEEITFGDCGVASNLNEVRLGTSARALIAQPMRN